MLISDTESVPSAKLNPVELEVIELFVAFSRALGQPRSVAEIYGILFTSESAMPMDELTLRLGLSKGSASQGLKFLRELGAVRMVYAAGDRRAHYEAVAELRSLASRFLRLQIIPHLSEGEARLQKVFAAMSTMPPETRSHLSGRLELLQSWGRNSRRVLPLLLRVLGDDHGA